MRNSAVERQLQIIGEAARRVSPAFREAHPEIPWRRIIGQRNVLVHEYDDIAAEQVWDVVTRGVAELVKLIEPLLPAEPPAAG